MSAFVALSRGKWSIGTRCQGYIGDTFGYHAKDLDVICFGKLTRPGYPYSAATHFRGVTFREDHGILSGPSVAGKSRSAVQRLLAGAVLNAEVNGEPIPTLPFVTSFVSAIPEHKYGDHTDSMTGHNLRTISAPQRFVISSDSSRHSGANIAEAEVDSFSRPSVSLITAATTIASTVDPAMAVKEKVVKPSIFSADSTSAGGTDLLWVALRILLAVTSLLVFFASVLGMEHDQLFTEFNVGAARQMSLSAEVRMRAEYNIRERRRLKSVVEEKDALLKVRDEEIGNLKAQLLLKEAEGEVEALKERKTTLKKEKNELDVKVVDLVALVKVREQEVADLDVVVTSVKSQNDNLVNQVHELEVSSAILQEKVTVYENCMGQLERFQDEQMKVVNDKFDKLYTDFIEMALHLEERFYPHLLTTIVGRRWLLTHGMELVIAKCLNSPEYLSALGATIGKAIEKGMQDGLAAGITHGREGRVLADVVAYNPSAEVDYVFALQQLQSVNFSLLAENNIANHRSALRDVFITLVEPLSTIALEGTEGTSGTALDTTTTLFVTFASASSIPPISTNDYEVVHAGGQEGAGADGQAVANENADPFPNVDDAELNIS
ncbi:hypothetical protein Tco_0429500 [Tanacetum coccineum]